MASTGYTPWAVTAGEQPTTAYWNILGENDASFNTGNGFNDGILVPRHLGTGSGLSSRLGLTIKTTTSSLLTTSYATYVTVTATSHGGECEALFGTILRDGSSGANRNGLIKVQIDGVDISPVDLFWSTNVSAGGNNTSLLVSSTPGAGSHTWTLQVKCATGSSVYLDQAFLKITEVY